MAGSYQIEELRCFYCDGVIRLTIDEDGIALEGYISHCPYCGKPLTIKKTPDPETQCGNCHAFFKPGDRYCRYCGTKKGEGAYEPYPSLVHCQVVYGPMPDIRRYVCGKCGYSWEAFQMNGDKLYCPKCGNKATGR